MLSQDEKNFFISTAIRAGMLSGCQQKYGAVLVRDRQLLSYGFNRKVIKDEKWEISAIYDAIFGGRSEDLSGTTLFCNYFPSLNDIILIVSVGVSSLNFMGKVDNAEVVNFLNKITEACIPLEIVELEIKSHT